VRELFSKARLEVHEQVESPVVEGAVAALTERDDAVGVVTAAARARCDAGRIDGVGATADQAAAS